MTSWHSDSRSSKQDPDHCEYDVVVLLAPPERAQLPGQDVKAPLAHRQPSCSVARSVRRFARMPLAVPQAHLRACGCIEEHDVALLQRERRGHGSTDKEHEHNQGVELYAAAGGLRDPVWKGEVDVVCGRYGEERKDEGLMPS